MPKLPLNNNKMQSTPLPSSPSGPPGSVQCAVCGKCFGRKSIIIHEPQCLKKLKQEHNSSPPGQVGPNSLKLGTVPKHISEPEVLVSTEGSLEPSPAPKRPNMIPCYLCGRLFSLSSVYIHEPQCLKKWRMENEKLPSNKRRQEPKKPDFVFTPDGRIDFGSMNDSYWKTHISQLIPCNVCGRTFNPDRVDVHERSCKG